MTREEVIAVIQTATKELGDVPSFAVLRKRGNLSKHYVQKHFGFYLAAVEAAGLERTGPGYIVELKRLFEDWGRVARKLGKIPSVIEYRFHGKYSTTPLTKRFGSWTDVAAGFLRYIETERLDEEWKDVLELAVEYCRKAPAEGRNITWASGIHLRPRIIKNEPIYGPPMANTHLMMAPNNESAVTFLFGAVARKLGFAVIRVQQEFPDCEAFLEVRPGQWQRVRIEFEYESRNFLLHRHSVEKCHFIVCWKHNWENCPLQVIELSSLMEKLMAEEDCCPRCRNREKAPLGEQEAPIMQS